MAIILRFTEPWVSATSPITLRFGDDTPAVTVAVGVTIPVTVVFDFAVNVIPVDTTFGIELGICWFALDAVQQALLLAQVSTEHESQYTGAWDNDNGTQINTDVEWSNPQSTGIHTQFAWAVGEQVRSDLAINWITPDDQQTVLEVVWLTPPDHMALTVLPWVNFTAVDREVSVTWIDGPQAEVAHIISYIGFVVDTEQTLKWGFHEPRWVCSTKYRPPVGKVTLRFNEPLSTQPNPIILRLTASPNYCYWDDGGGLIDSSPVLPPLDFKIPIEPQIRRYYLMQPTVTCVRVSDGTAIVITSVSISQSRGQWARAVSLEFSSRIDAERAHNELLLITINGYEFYAIAEQPSVSKVFGSATYSSTGRSRVAELAAPYKLPLSYTNATARSFAGLLGDLLQTTGWTVELSGIPDFTIPAGAFSVGNKTPIEAVAEAVGQLGCMILNDDAAKKLTIVPRWPTAPWAMATAVPDLALHDAVITSYSDSVSRNPLCNVVWLRGEQQGISAKVKRAGSAGNIPAADISAQLIVDNQAARVAGTNALAETGDKLSVNLSMPVMADLPPATPGMLVGVTINSEVFKGVCDSWTIRASISDRGDIDIEQSITLISPLES